MLIDNLKSLLIKNKFFNIDKDTNEVDGLNGYVVIPRGASTYEKIETINLCNIIGFESTALDLPIVKIIDIENEVEEFDINSKDYPISINNKNLKESKVKFEKNFYEIKDLADLNNINKGLLLDTDNDFLPDYINAQIIIDEKCNDNELIAACNISTILGLNSLGCSSSIGFTNKDANLEIGKINIYIGDEFLREKLNNKNSNIVFIKEENALIIGGKEEEILEVSKFFCENYEYFIKPNEVSLEEFKNELKVLLINQEKPSKEIIFEKEFNFEWEVDEVKHILNKKLLDNLNFGDEVEIKVLVSEEKEIRDNLKEYIENKVQSKGCKLVKCSVLCSYKQGLSWIMEEIVPKIKCNMNTEEISAIDIKFKPFLPKGKTKWDDEDGSIPNIDASRKDNPDKFFDLPIRLVQELFPIDDLMEGELGISRDNINFDILEDKDYSYELVVYNKYREVVLSETFDVIYSERPYLSGFEDIGKVHPNTGLIQVKVNQETIINKIIKTDVEKIWDAYQDEILNDCKTYILDKTKGNPTKEKQPFFNTLKLDILTSEPDYKLNVRQDIISVLSALHEDIYFAGLDFFKTLGLRTVNEVLDEPGLILPIINKRNGQGTYMKATLEVLNTVNYGDLGLELYINEIYIKNNEIDKVYVDIVGDNKAFNNIKQEINKLEEKISKENYAFNTLVIRHDNQEIYINNANKYEKVKNIIGIKDIDIPQDRVIGYDEYIEIINKLRNVDGINILRASKSYQGRDIYAIELVKKYKSSFVSKNKLINNKPVFQINNRHHANEVSSTNSAFLLIEQILSNEDYKKYLDKVNIVMIPFENVDGGYIHYELQKDNPQWQFHIARFNSVGKEFAREYFKEDSKYTESRALTKLWYKWLPDILVDNHGVPKHEWDQQFSGYTSPWFKGFWLPRALFYGYFWYLDDERYPGNKLISEALQDVVSDYINEDEEITKWNMDWQNRFEKYAHQWMPKLFPANYYKDLIYYWIPYKVDENSWHVSHRYPWITAVDWTTEVSDETAQGDYLELCSKTHNLSDIATIDMMYNAKFERKREVIENEKEVLLKDIRIRPIQV
ncbi:MAG: M14 family metallopeptidase [Paraclostridium sp.]|uniref:M14 family metallopeptidase n=1 Tax=Paraclostridium sp. TaxID=2023273 RepID=UPI003F3EAD11